MPSEPVHTAVSRVQRLHLQVALIIYGFHPIKRWRYRHFPGAAGLGAGRCVAVGGQTSLLWARAKSGFLPTEQARPSAGWWATCRN